MAADLTQQIASSTSMRAALPESLPRADALHLRDGTTLVLRPTRPDDIERLKALFERVSPQSMWMRFFTPRSTVDPRLLQLMVETDGVERMNYVVTEGEGPAEIALAVAGYVLLPHRDTAEVAFMVDDAHQGQGVGTLLLERLASYASAHGIVRFVADVHGENNRMLEVFRTSGFKIHSTEDHGVVHFELPAAGDDGARSSADAREQVAVAASLASLFRPRSIAVIGASRAENAIGHRALEGLLRAGFSGPVYPINPSAHSVSSVRAYPSILDVPDEIDLAVIAVPAARVLEVVDDCARKRVRGLIVLSAGFAEIGLPGRALQDQLVAKVRAHGMRMVGPNCLGLLNTAPGISMNASFSPGFPPAGKVAMSSQSGALGLAILDYAAQLGIGISSFVAVGNKADVSSNDLLQYWEQDLETNVIILYLESFGNPRKFSRIARRVARAKPILAVKGGRSRSGARAAQSHTAALASDERAVEALFRQAGVIRAETLEELFDIASILANQPLPADKRIAIVTNAGGPAILAADACEGAGLDLPSLSEATLTALRGFLPPEASLNNPVDMIASASAEHYERTVAAVLRDPGVDAVIVIFIPVGLTDGADVAAAMWRAVAGAADQGKTVISCFMSSRGLAGPLAPEDSDEAALVIPSFRFPEAAARALARVAEYSAWRQRPAGAFATPANVNVEMVRAVVREASAPGSDGWLTPEAAGRLLAAAGVPVEPFEIVGRPEEAIAAAARIGLPVAVKVVSRQILHKTDVGGVVVGLDTLEAVRTACEAMQGAIAAPIDGFMVQRMAPAGTELMIGVVEDRSFGPLVGFGLGGRAVEVLNDVVFRITPLTDVDAHEMVRSIRGARLLQGFRGAPAADLAALEDLLLRIAWLAETLPELLELDINPAIAMASGVSVVDVRIRLRQAD